MAVVLAADGDAGSIGFAGRGAGRGREADFDRLGESIVSVVGGGGAEQLDAVQASTDVMVDVPESDLDQ